MAKVPDKKTGLFSIVVIALFFVCVAFFGVMSYGGIRTPDGEIMFMTGEALAKTGSLAVEKEFDAWKGFGIARGVDGRLYSGYAPGQSLLLAPIIKLALRVNQSRWYETTRFNIPVSLTVSADSLKIYLQKRRPAAMEKHALRFLVLLFVPVITALVVVVFYLVVVRLTDSVPAALTTSVLLALATPLWSYSGTLFKEPFVMLWTLLSFYCLVANDLHFGAKVKQSGRLFLAGLLLGLGFFTHVKAVLMVPFFLAYGVWPYFQQGSGMARAGKKTFLAGLTFAAGFSVFTMVFCWLNYTRFGHILETGRLVTPVSYGTFVAPWEGLAGLLISPGKGVVWFCPVVLAGLLWWRQFYKNSRHLSAIIAGMVLFHWVFLSFRSDWHGGFCLGPRHLLPMVPFVLIPIAFHLTEWFSSPVRLPAWKRRLVGLFFWGCVIQQVYFCLGEPVSFYYLIKQYHLERGVSIISNNMIYFDWQASPLFHLLAANRGPYLLQSIPMNNKCLFVVLVAAVGLLTLVFVRLVGKTAGVTGIKAASCRF